ncbi:hypothetical protein F3Y22_tig00111330pilonHSYRG00176 [Hibiscus syriacus]|uniref:Integrase catalytic domain-containing protein n=1 Tax=Hibiscus syriacus TaxID=106335 RepID=A0A6A2YPY6_HIBSY|nr:hypothetical protein F3Y22_tig00111330pilonHSYRG00176 [Hibiscus syriacus]
MKNENWALLDRQALGVIRLTLSRNVAFNIAKEKITAGLMAAISSMYEKSSASNKVHLMRQLLNLRMAKGASVAQRLNELNTITTQLSSVEIEFDDEVQALILLSSLPDSWNATVTAVTSSSGNSKLKFDDVRDMDNLTENDIVQPFQAMNGRLPKEYSSLLMAHYIMSPSSMILQGRSDNGGEYKNSRFRDFCANNGIKMETTVPMTPQQNGIAEHMNKTLNERAISMRIHASLPKLLWAETINTAAYLINRGPLIPLDGGIPEEVWSKKEINLSHLRVFGCISYVHINSAEGSKLDAKSNKYVFVGYGGDEFGYRFWDYENRKIIRSRDVIFNENISPEAVQEEPVTPELRLSSRIPKPTQCYSPSLHYLLLTDNGELECYDEEMQVEDSIKWESSMKFEMDSFMSNKTWKLAELPPGKLVLKIVVAENLHLEQLDIKTAFLHGVLEEEIYMSQPEVFIEWYNKFDSLMGSNGFIRCQADHCCYIKKFHNNFIILLLYVDDMLVSGLDMQEIINLKQKLSKQFAIKDLGATKHILGMRIKRDTKSGTLMVSQAEYINKVVSRFNMQDAKPESTPLGVHFILFEEQSPKTEKERAHMMKVPYALVIGSLMYAMVCTRPYIAHPVGVVSRYMNNPGKVHWEAVKWILRHLRGTTNKTLCFKGGDTMLTGYVDADLAENVDIRRSITGYVYTLGGTTISWVSQLQKIVAFSSTEAEYVSVMEANKEIVWLQSFLEELGKKQENNVLFPPLFIRLITSCLFTSTMCIQLNGAVGPAFKPSKDDLILYAKASVDQAHLVDSSLADFSIYSSHRINKAKSQVFFSQIQARMLQMKSVVFLLEYTTTLKKLFNALFGVALPKPMEFRILFTDTEKYWIKVLRHKYKLTETCLLTIARNGSHLWRDLPKIGHPSMPSCLDLWLMEPRPTFGIIIGYRALRHIRNTPPPTSNSSTDRCYWNHETNGHFSVKAAYNLISTPAWLSISNNLNLIWKHQAPEQINYFLWLCLHDKLLCNVNRWKRHLTKDPICEIWGGCDESSLHILRYCNETQSLWELFIPEQHLHDFFNFPLDHWILANISMQQLFSGLDHTWKSIFTALIWQLWKRQNSSIFNDEGTAGGILQSSGGAWLVGFNKYIGHSSIPQAELWSLYEGLRIAWIYGYDKIQCQMDCADAYNLITPTAPSPSPLALPRMILRIAAQN